MYPAKEGTLHSVYSDMALDGVLEMNQTTTPSEYALAQAYKLGHLTVRQLAVKLGRARWQQVFAENNISYTLDQPSGAVSPSGDPPNQDPGVVHPSVPDTAPGLVPFAADCGGGTKR